MSEVPPAPLPSPGALLNDETLHIGCIFGRVVWYVSLISMVAHNIGLGGIGRLGLS